jgi:hypothetical protein
MKKAKEIIGRLRGRGKNILDLEPQEYINTIRSDDRIGLDSVFFHSMASV